MNIQTKAVLTFTQEDIINALLAYAESQGFEAKDKEVIAQDIPEELVLELMSKSETLPRAVQPECRDAHCNHSAASQEPRAKEVFVSNGRESSSQTNSVKQTRNIFDDDLEEAPKPKKCIASLFA